MLQNYIPYAETKEKYLRFGIFSMSSGNEQRKEIFIGGILHASSEWIKAAETGQHGNFC